MGEVRRFVVSFAILFWIATCPSLIDLVVAGSPDAPLPGLRAVIAVMLVIGFVVAFWFQMAATYYALDDGDT